MTNFRSPKQTERLFVALEMPVTWNDALGQLQDKVRAAMLRELPEPVPRLRWTRPEGIHLTLKFLGETPRSLSGPIDHGLRESVEAIRAFSLQLGRLGTFEDRRGPRVLWVDVEGEQEPLLELARRVDVALSLEADLPREQRPFQPHLTLARIPEEAARELRFKLDDVLAGIRTPRPGPHRFAAVSLMRSHLERGGARYERVRSYRLV
ncbi:MAG: RNA 2',3'-cyclic phosphodiesterase [Dehalococcoidia bacterium]